jgi:hypothetical protein
MKRLIVASALSAVALSASALEYGAPFEHPAVIVARAWNTRGIDPNTFIVLHPAAPQFLAVSPTEKDKVTASKHAPRTP